VSRLDRAVDRARSRYQRVLPCGTASLGAVARASSVRATHQPTGMLDLTTDRAASCRTATRVAYARVRLAARPHDLRALLQRSPRHEGHYRVAAPLRDGARATATSCSRLPHLLGDASGIDSHRGAREDRRRRDRFGDARSPVSHWRALGVGQQARATQATRASQDYANETPVSPLQSYQHESNTSAAHQKQSAFKVYDSDGVEDTEAAWRPLHTIRKSRVASLTRRNQAARYAIRLTPPSHSNSSTTATATTTTASTNRTKSSTTATTPSSSKNYRKDRAKSATATKYTSTTSSRKHQYQPK